MKKIFMTGVVLSTQFSAHSQDLEISKLPAVVKNSFEAKYPGTTAKWEKEAGNYEGNFKHQGDNVSVLLNLQGVILETETEVKVEDLPQAAIIYLKGNYKNKPVKEAAKIIKANGTVKYEAEVEKTDLVFNENGKFLKELKKNEQEEEND